MAPRETAAGAAREDRRAFFTRLFWGLAGLLGALVGVPVLGAFLSPGFRKPDRGRHPLHGRAPPGRHVTEGPRPGGWLQERLGGQIFGGFLNRNVPEETGLPHTLGSATLFLLVVQVVTGIVLAMNYAPSP